MSYQLSEILSQKSKATKIFTVTKDKFKKAVDLAMKYQAKNATDINALDKEIFEKNKVNAQLKAEIVAMTKSIHEIDKILGA